MGWVALLIGLVLLVFVVTRWWHAASMAFAAVAFLVLSPSIFVLHMLSLGNVGNSDRAEGFLAVAVWLPPVLSLVWFVVLVARQPRSALTALKPHVLFTQPVLAVFLASALAVLVVWEYEMKSDELLTMSLFALVVFLVCAWFLPYVLRPMLKLKGRSPDASAAMATLLGLILSLMVALAAFKARERFAELHTAMNTLIDAVVVFLVAALSGAGVLLAAQKVARRDKAPELPPQG